MNFLYLSLLVLLTSAALAQDYKELSYSSYAVRNTAWTASQYVGDLKDIVKFDDAIAHVVEFRSSSSSGYGLDLAAAIRSNEEGEAELESFFGAIEAGGIFLRLESSGANGYIKPAEKNDRFSSKFLIGSRDFDAKYTQLNIGTELESNMGARWGLGYIEVVQPAEIDIYTVRLSGGFSDQPNYPDALIDPEYTTRLLGLWFDVDNLQAAMHNQSGFALDLTQSGNLHYGPGLTMDVVFGLMSGQSSANLKQIVNDNYGLSLKYDEPVGMGWSISYKLEYIFAYNFPASNIGLSLGLEGRALQNFFDTQDLTGASHSVDSANEAVGQFGIGDNTVFHYGPFVRVAWEM